MRVLHLLKTSIGAAWAHRQIRELVLQGVDVHVALPSGGPLVGAYRSVGAVEHILQTDFPIRAPWKFPVLRRDFRNLISEISPDLIHSHFVGTTLTMRLSLRDKKFLPRIFQVPGPLHLESFFFRSMEILTAQASDTWIGSCDWTCERYISSGISRDKVFLSYYGVDLDKFKSGAPGKLRAELGLSSDVKIIGMVAYIYPPKAYLGQKRGLKGHEDLIDAFQACLNARNDLRLVIVGGAWNNSVGYENKLRSYAHSKCGENVIFLGNRSDIPDLYADFDLAVHPSHSENVGGAVESALSSTPTIATSVGGFPDVVKEGVTGWLVPPKSSAELAKKILFALDNSSQSAKCANNARQLVSHMFDIKRTSAGVCEVYNKILSSDSISA